MKKEYFKTRIDYLLMQAEEVEKTRYAAFAGGDYVNEGMLNGFRTACLSLLNNLVGKNNAYYTEVINLEKSNSISVFESIVHILRELRHEVEMGWLARTKQLLAAEIFSDFMEMAFELMKGGYKDASAVMIGSVLERHLRDLCEETGIETTVMKDGVPRPKKADRLNSELAKHEIYDKLEQKQITAWLDLRNKAAHGEYSEYSKEQVNLMYQGVLDFIARTKPSTS